MKELHKVTQLALSVIHPEWLKYFQTLLADKSLVDLLDETIIKVIASGHKLCPDHPTKVLKCFAEDPNNIKVVICGQDPYPQPRIATGYAFACEDKFQPSLNIMVRELAQECGDLSLGIDTPFDGTLKHWIDQGVMLLNTSLSTQEFNAGAHAELWRDFMNTLFWMLNDMKLSRESMNSIVFVFLGKQAQSYASNISELLHFKIMRNHPAAETHGSVKFVGFFNEVNKYLEESGQDKINWI